MHSGIHDVVGSASTFDGVTHFRQLGIFDFIGGAREAVRAANFLHGVGRDGEHLIRDEEKHDSFRLARAARFFVVLSGGLHRTATGMSLHNFAIRFSMAALIPSSGSTSSTAPA